MNRGTIEEFACIECCHRKEHTFQTVAEITEWCERKTIEPDASWIDTVIKCGQIRLNWCDMQNIIPPDRVEGVINQEKNSFIPNVWDACPHFSREEI